MDCNKEKDAISPSGSQADVPLDVLALHSTNLLTVLDEDGVVQYASPSIECMLGYEHDELVGGSRLPSTFIQMTAKKSSLRVPGCFHWQRRQCRDGRIPT